MDHRGVGAAESAIKSANGTLQSIKLSTLDIEPHEFDGSHSSAIQEIIGRRHRNRFSTRQCAGRVRVSWNDEPRQWFRPKEHLGRNET